MKKRLFLALLCLSGSLNAAPLQGIRFSHHDWELVCDNTGACRAAGYQDDADTFRRSASVLLTRSAGAHEPVVGQFALAAPDDADNFQFPPSVDFILNNQSLGSLKLGNDGYGTFSPTQTQTLLQSLKQHGKIQFKSEQYTWEVSDKGAAAVLLKADEFQQRVNTPSAWLKRGNSTRPVLPQQAKPQIQAAKVPQTGQFTLKSGAKNHRQVLNLLRVANQKQGEHDECFHLQNDEMLRDIQVYPLNAKRVLLETSCIEGAYQTTMFYAIADKSLAQIVQVLPNEYGGMGDFDPKSGELSGSFKGRGLGDCWHTQTAVWNGKTFVKTAEEGSQMCRGFVGGAWRMPQFVSDVVRQK